jgi:hypothetical protein
MAGMAGARRSIMDFNRRQPSFINADGGIAISAAYDNVVMFGR